MSKYNSRISVGQFIYLIRDDGTAQIIMCECEGEKDVFKGTVDELIEQNKIWMQEDDYPDIFSGIVQECEVSNNALRIYYKEVLTN